MIRALLVVVVSVATSLGVASLVGGPPIGGVPALVVLAALALGIQWVAFVPAWLGRTERFYDLVGSLTYLTLTAVASWTSVRAGTASIVSIGCAILVAIWAGRLGSFLFLRIRRAGHDRRFDQIKQSAPRFLVAWTLQGLWVFATSLAALVLILEGPPITPAVWIGGALWAIGFAIEGIADRQKSAFNERQGEERRWVDVGLWRWSRHPNYFGEIVLWTGVFVAGLQTWSGAQWLTVISPLFVTWLLTQISGVPMLEVRADERWGDDPAYQAYKQRTSVLIPWPPGGRG